MLLARKPRMALELRVLCRSALVWGQAHLSVHSESLLLVVRLLPPTWELHKGTTLPSGQLFQGWLEEEIEKKLGWTERKPGCDVFEFGVNSRALILNYFGQVLSHLSWLACVSCQRRLVAFCGLTALKNCSKVISATLSRVSASFHISPWDPKCHANDQHWPLNCLGSDKICQGSHGFWLCKLMIAQLEEWIIAPS